MSKKVLFFVDRMRTGGIQKLLLDLYKAFDKDKVEVECLLLDDGEEYSMEADLRNLGCKVHKLRGIWLRKPQDFILYRKAVRSFFKQHHDYAAVHMNSGPKNYYVLACAKKHGIPVRIAHSHNSDYQTKSKVQKIIGNLCKIPLKKVANVYMACSEPAAEWMFGKRAYKSGKVKELINGVDIKKFAYNAQTRNRIREELGTESNLVIGNVGRFTEQKNHIRMIEIFSAIHKKNNNTILVLAGVGDLMGKAKSRAEELGLSESIKFLGFRTDVFDLLQAMDVYIMPSLYEGFPVTGVEAQVAGLPCVFSDTITKEVCISDNTKYIPLDESDEVWADAVLASVNNVDRVASENLLREKGFDIKDMARALESIYNI